MPRTGFVIAAAVIWSMILEPKVGPAVAVVDIVLGVLIAAGFSKVFRPGSPVRATLGRTLPWLWVILLGSVAGLFGVGLTGWALDTLVRDAVSFAIFYATFALAAQSEWVVRMGLNAVALTVGALALVILTTNTTYRPAGTFANPNYAGHYLAFGAVLLFTARYRTLAVRFGLLGLAALAILQTGSFGSLSMLAAGGIFYMFSRVRHDRRTPVRLAFLVMLVVFVASTWQAYRAVEEARFVLGPSISSYRFSNSSTVRQELWEDAIGLIPDNPLGVGPYGIKSRALVGRGVEVHNDLLAYVVERGAIGLIGLFGFLWALRRSARPGGSARLLLVLVVVGGMFRETLHFRHMWLMLGLAFAYDSLRQQANVGPADEAVERTQGWSEAVGSSTKSGA